VHVEVGSVLGRYTLLREIGRGGMGRVFAAADPDLGREVALKVLTSDEGELGGSRERLEREARAAAALRHPSIVTVYSLEEAENVRFITMELVAGLPLDDLIAPPGMALDRFLALGVALADGLAAAHSHGLVHRDLKPSNLLVDSDDRLKILDFGLVKRMAHPGSPVGGDTTEVLLTGKGVIVGTLPYMSPEQILGTEVGCGSDVFSLGIVFHEMLTGYRPFEGANVPALAAAILRDPARPLAECRPGLPASLAALIHRCLEKSPGDRPTAAQVHDTLSAFRYGPSSALSAAPTEPPTGAVRSEPFPVVAVMPLREISSSAEQLYFVDGLTESLIAELAKLSRLRVIARGSVMPYRESDKEVAEIGRELGASAVFTGSITRAGSTIRLLAQLFSLADDRYVWAESFERPLAHLPSLQGELARSIARAVDVSVTASEAHQITPSRHVVPEALELYLRGRQASHLRTESGLRRGLAHYKQALTIDPTDPAVHVGIAEAYVLLAAFGFLPTVEALERARAAALAALRIDPESAAARCALAAVITPLEWNRRAAEAAYREAIALSPGYSLAYHWYAELLTSCKRFDEALAAAEKARSLDPLSEVLGVLPAWIHYFARDHDRASELARRAVNLDPDFAFAHFVLGLALEGRGDAGRAAGSFEQALRLSPRAVEYEAALGHAQALSGDEASARSLFQALETSTRERFVSPCALALVAVGLEDRERALSLLEQGAEERDHDLYFLAVDPRLDPLRTEPRFVALEKRVCD